LDSIRIARDLPDPRGFDLGQVRITSYKPNRIKLAAELTRPSIVVASEVYYPGWEALIDGKPAPLLCANYVLRAVPVPAGKHQIEMRFRSQTFQWGLAISLLALAAALCYLRLTRFS
jgi:uncharacterized membrane protein YfhO